MAEAYVGIQHEQVATGSCGTLTCGELSGVPSLWSLSESPSASMIYCRELARGSVLTVTWHTIRACTNAVTTYLVPQLILFTEEPGQRKTQYSSVPYHCG